VSVSPAYHDLHPGLRVIDLLASVGIIRQTSAGGAPTRSGDVWPEYRVNVARNGQAFCFDAHEAAMFAKAIAKVEADHA